MPFPRNLTEIDPLTSPDHHYLLDSDKCYFLGEYTARKGYAFSDTNGLIINLKKPPDRRGKREWQFKERDIRVAGQALRNAINDTWLEQAVFVPIPPSKAKGDPLYDDRMVRILHAINPQNPVNIRELILQTESTEAAHYSDESRDPHKIQQLYSIDETLTDPVPKWIVICDDVLTTGAHFKAAQAILSGVYPAATLCGIFIARRVPEAIDFEDFFEIIEP